MVRARYLLLLLVPGCDQLFKITDIASDAPVDARVLPAHCLYEDFAGGSLLPDRWTIASTATTAPTVAITSGELVIAAHASEPGSNYNSIRSTTTFDLTGGEVMVELLEPTLQMAGVPTETQFYIDLDAANRYQFSILNGSVVARTRVSDTEVMIKTSTYLASSFHWLRLHHDATASTISWDVATKDAPDDWSALAKTAVNDVPVTAVHVDLAAGTYNKVSEPGQARFDNVLVSAPACNAIGD